jgi:hypothetical protein
MNCRIKYFCLFDTWDQWMDGILDTGLESIEYDFVDINNVDDINEIVLNPFTEDEARKHFASKGFPDIQFIYTY